MRRILVTGTAGFIGFHLARLLLAEGFRVHGYDGMTDYYDVALKRRRHAMLLQDPNFSATEGMLEDQALFDRVADEFAPEVIVHLAAQAGVRYSVENPRAYLDANVIGSFSVMEAARRLKVAHLMMASTSSVYGANEEMPFRETDKADRQLTMQSAPSGWPVRAGYISSEYGFRIHPTRKARIFHEGIDFASKHGSPVMAVAAGVVVFSGRRNGYGRVVDIRHANGLITRYAHNSANLVEEGDPVRQGQQIARVGSSGTATGPHVHFEVLRGGRAVDPMPYLDVLPRLAQTGDFSSALR